MNPILKIEPFKDTISVAIMSLTLAFCLGLFIYYVYKKVYSQKLHAQDLGMNLIVVTIIMTLVNLAVQRNLIFLMGLIIGLCIVCLRISIKDPMNILFLFWALAVGFALASGFYIVAILASLIIGGVLLFFSKQQSKLLPYTLIIQCENRTAEICATQYIKNIVEKQVIKSKTVQSNRIELKMEIYLKNNNTEFMNDLTNITGVTNVVMRGNEVNQD